jgi:hypothetical protein
MKFLQLTVLVICLFSPFNVFAQEQKYEAGFFVDSMTKGGIFHADLTKAILKDKLNVEATEEVNDIVDGLHTGVNLADYFLGMKSVSSEAIKYYKGASTWGSPFARGFFSNTASYANNISKSADQIISFQKNANNTLAALQKSYFAISELPCVKNGFCGAKANQLKVLEGQIIQIKWQFSQNLTHLNKINNSISGIDAGDWFKQSGRVGKSLKILGVLSIGLDASAATQDVMKGNYSDAAVNAAKWGIHSLQLNPIVGLITTPVEIATNLAVDGYNNSTTTEAHNFYDTIDYFDKYFKDVRIEIDTLFNMELTASQYREKFYDQLLLRYIAALIAFDEYNEVDKTYHKGMFNLLKNTDTPHDDFVAYYIVGLVSDDIETAVSGIKEQISNQLLMYMPISVWQHSPGKFQVNLTDYSLNGSEDISPGSPNDSQNKNQLMNLFINDLKALSESYYKYSEKDYLISNVLKERLSDSAHQFDDFFSSESGIKTWDQDVQRNTRESFKNDKWKLAAWEVWLINHFEKKLLKKKVDDWLKYIQSTLFYSAIKDGPFAMDDIVWADDGYIDFSYYSQNVVHSMELHDLAIFKEGVDLTANKEAFKNKLAGIARIEEGKIVFNHQSALDVPRTNVHYSAIEFLVENGAINLKELDSYPNFLPQDSISQIDALRMLVDLVFKDEISSYTSTETSLEEKYFKFITFQLGDLGTFNFANRHQKFSRAKIAELLAKAVKNQTDGTFLQQNIFNIGANKFILNIDESKGWDVNSTLLKALNISKGDTDGVFNPNNLVTRGEAASLIAKSYQFSNKVGD